MCGKSKNADCLKRFMGKTEQNHREQKYVILAYTLGGTSLAFHCFIASLYCFGGLKQFVVYRLQ
jgi:hypothetical protein